MNIIEAIKSGKKFKRENETDWYDPCDYYNSFSREAIISEDWQIEPPNVKITRGTLINAYIAARQSDTVQNGMTDVLDELIKQLGL